MVDFEDSPGRPEPVPPQEAGPSSGATTTLPAAPPTRPGRPPIFWLLLGFLGVLVVLAIVLAVNLTGRHSTPASLAPAARARGVVSRKAVFAASDAALPDAAAVITDVHALLAGRLSPATPSGSVTTALTHPPTAGGSPTLSAALALTDPQLPHCLAAVTGGDTLFGIDRIVYAGQPSLLIITADNDAPTRALAYVIGTGCALPGTGIRTVVSVPLSTAAQRRGEGST